MTVVGLRKELEQRGLTKTGVKDDLIRRIEEHDRKYTPQPPPSARDQFDLQRLDENNPTSLARRGEREYESGPRGADRYRPQYNDDDEGGTDVARDKHSGKQATNHLYLWR